MTVDRETIRRQLNKCYLEFDPDWKNAFWNGHRAELFQHYVRENGGLDIVFKSTTDQEGRWGYELVSVNVVDEVKFTMWLLRWA